MKELKERISPKRLLTDKELEEYLNLKTDKAKGNYLEKLKDQLWYVQKKEQII